MYLVKSQRRQQTDAYYTAQTAKSDYSNHSRQVQTRFWQLLDCPFLWQLDLTTKSSRFSRACQTCLPEKICHFWPFQCSTELRGVQLEMLFELRYQAQEIRCQQRNTEILKKILPNSCNQKLILVLTGQEIKKHKQTENLSKKNFTSHNEHKIESSREQSQNFN